ncbi:MAG TPA: rod shape-determining protein RodA [Candidatus Avacidaminococcus intestinavium]|uniref:Peptidoglycan glycosyltransferase RodA n=1 Tax=Candidatus Avacidaminococcus intestinavium TaxID=2840684 RepID=A0A9D1MR82_9FIRM|nr:rod shape-determining protein RodA [Candidatus Avacidaminococcus intestinavium]
MEFTRILKRLDYILLLAVLLLVGIGIMLIGSATHVNVVADDRYWYVGRQMTFAALNLVFMFFCLRFDYRVLEDLSTKLYIFNLLMLVAVMVFGQTALGAQRWIQLGPISIQPSEFSKIIMIIALAAFLNKRLDHLESFWDWVPVFGYVFVPFILVMKQPDLGTSLVFLAILFGLMVLCGFKKKYFMRLIGVGVVSAPLLWTMLQEYQKMRLKVFLDPGLEPQGAGYHVIQSMIAIGSGELVGKGLFAGTQSQLNFLPENHTDFIFAVAGEEFGFIGTTFILLLYLLIIYRGINIAMDATDNFGTLLAVGIVSMFVFHVLVNVGMTAGIMPVTGVPLPFLSYGVSSLTTNMILTGLLLNIEVRQQKLSFM